MTDWRWVSKRYVLAAHHDQIVAHGGSHGVREEGAVDSALARPMNLAAYGEPDIAALAAAYAFGLARNHPFVDGNKRTAFLAATTFLELNGFRFTGNKADSAVTFLKLAAGEMSEDELAAWFRANCAPPDET